MPPLAQATKGLDPAFPVHHGQHGMSGSAVARTGEIMAHCPCWESLGDPEAGRPSALVGFVLSLKRILRSVPEASSLLIHSGSVILLLLQTDSRETGRSSLLPGLVMAAQGVHTSPEVTASRHTDGGLSFLTDATLVVLWGGGWPCAQEAA